jgi:hypothetical protein
MRTLRVIALVAAALIVAAAARAESSRPQPRDPVELWRAFPLGAPKSRAATSVTLRRPVTPPSGRVADVAAFVSEGGSSFPIGAVLGGAGGALLLGLALTIVLLRRRGDTGGALAVVEDPPPRPEQPSPEVTVWWRDIEGTFERHAQSELERAPRRRRALRGEERDRFVEAVASRHVAWDTYGDRRPQPRRKPVSEGQEDDVAVAEPETVVEPRNEGDQTMAAAEPRPRLEIGDRVNEIILAAENAAGQLRAEAVNDAAQLRARAEDDARSRVAAGETDAQQTRADAETYANDTRNAVDSYATQRRREVEAETSRLHSEAEAHARAVREAAEEMAKRLEADARAKVAALEEEATAIDTDLQQTLRGVRDVGARIERLLQHSRQEGSLIEALSVDRRSSGADDGA